MNDEVGIAVIRSLAEIDQNKLISPVIVYKACCRINIQGCAADDQNIRGADVRDRLREYILIQAFFIQNNVRADHAAAVTAGYPFAVVDHIGRIGLAAFGAIGAQDAAVQFQHALAAGCLMESVNVLRNSGAKYSLPLQFSQAQMRPVGLDVFHDKLGTVKAIVFLRIAHKKAVT